MDAQPTLKGIRFLNTRPHHQASDLSQAIKAAKGEVIECPTLMITPIQEDWTKKLPDLSTVSVAIFVSANAVTYCFQTLNEKHIAWPNHIKVIAIGKATEETLYTWGISTYAMPAIPDSEHVMSLEVIQSITNETVLLFKGQGGRPLITNELRKKNVTVIPISVYAREIPPYQPEFIQSIWQKDLVDIILISSEQSLQNLHTMFGQEAEQWLMHKTYLVFSERLAKCAADHGLKKVVISRPENIISTLITLKD